MHLGVVAGEQCGGPERLELHCDHSRSEQPCPRSASRTSISLDGFGTGDGKALRRHLSTYTGADADAPVFAGASGGTLRANAWRRRFWLPATRAARVAPLRIHDMRHTAVALWIAAGANPKQIAAWAGHSSVSVVLDRYGHLFEGHEAAVLSRLDAFAECVSVPAGDAECGGVPRVFRGAPASEQLTEVRPPASDQGEQWWAQRDSNP